MNSSLYIKWTDKNNTGIPILDEQHKGIVSLINSLHFSITQKDSNDITQPIARSIELYTEIHFQTEELFLHTSLYPDIENHLHLHHELRHAIKKDERHIEPIEYLKFLKNWWLGHINIEDMKYVAHVSGYLN